MCPACCFKWHASRRQKASGVLGYLSRPIAYLLAMKEIYIRTKDHSILDYEASKWHYDLYGTYLIERNGTIIKLNGRLSACPGFYSSIRPDLSNSYNYNKSNGYYWIWR